MTRKTRRDRTTENLAWHSRNLNEFGTGELTAKNAKFAKGNGFVGATGWSPFLAAHRGKICASCKNLQLLQCNAEITKGDPFLCSMRPFDFAQGMPLRLGSCQRRALFDAQDEIDRRREQLIADIEGKLQQRESQEMAFSIRWKLT